MIKGYSFTTDYARRLQRKFAAAVLSIMLAIIMPFGLIPATAFAVEDDQTSDVLDSTLTYDGNEIHGSTIHSLGTGIYDLAVQSIHSDGGGISTYAALPSEYSSVEKGVVTPVRDQYTFDLCWSFASTAAIESSMLSEGLASDRDSLDLSERHLAYFTFNRVPDALGGTAGDTVKATVPFTTNFFSQSTDPYLGAGGNSFIAMTTMASWMGVVDESKAPYSELRSKFEPIYDRFFDPSNNQFKGTIQERVNAVNPFLDATKLSDDIAYEDAWHLENADMISMLDRDEVKKAVMEHGAVSVLCNGDSWNVNSDGYMYTNEAEVNHMVAIVGWKDDVPTTKFGPEYSSSIHRPKNPGAWLCKNSWGSGWANDGYFWIAYDDASINDNGAYAFDMAPADNFDNIYQYDGTANTVYFSVDSGTIFANLFEASANPGGAEELKAVGMTTYSTNVDYSIQVYIDPTDDSDPTTGTAALTQPVTGTTKFGGFHTIELPEPVKIPYGSKYAVAITVSGRNGADVDFAIDASSGNLFKNIVNTNQCEIGQSSYKVPGYDFYDLKNVKASFSSELSDFTARVKAFTDNVDDETPDPGLINISQASATVNGSFVYNGNAHQPDPVVQLNGKTLQKGVDYDVSYSSNVNAGNATITIRGKGAYTGTKTVTFRISPKPISETTLAPIGDQTYTGSPITPNIVVTDGSKTLTANTDYTANISNNTNVGTATVIINGRGNYTGTKQGSFKIVAAPGGGQVVIQVMYRLYNPNSGEHFYTADAAEKNRVVRAGWRYEGIGWTAPVKSNTPVYRLYSGTDHHYTLDAKERDNLIRVGWRYEGIGWYSDDAKGVPLYRQFNPNVNPKAARNNSGSHNYTTSKAENDNLVRLGWRAEGIGWYGVKVS